MKFRFIAGFAIITCGLFASCTPWEKTQQKQKPAQGPQQTVSSQEQQKIKAEQDKMKKEAETKKKETTEVVKSETENTTTVSPPPPAVEKKSSDYPFANKIPGKPGHVFSPYNQKVIDVRDMPSGTLVQDPTYPASEKKYFRVP